MARKSKTMKRTRRRYSPEFKQEALDLAEKVGVGGAAAQLDLQTSQLYGWRTSAGPEMDPGGFDRDRDLIKWNLLAR